MRTLGDLKKEPELLCIEEMTTHSFGPGLYVREFKIPKGVACIGHYQRFEHLNIIMYGKVRMLIDNDWVDVSGPRHFIGAPGRKIGVALEDTLWLNVFQTDERDIKKIEERLVIKDDTDMLLLELKNRIQDYKGRFLT